MPNFLLRILKQKRVLFFAVLFLGLMLVPRPTHALFGLDTIASYTVDGIFLTVPMALKFIFRTFCEVSSAVLTYTTQTVFTWSITKDTVYLSSWTMTRDWANMLIVIALIGVAVATILRLREYEAKKLLPALIIIALLVNFSTVFVGLMIDVSNILVNDLLHKSGNPEASLLTSLNTRNDYADEWVSYVLGRAGTYETWPGLLNDLLKTVSLVSLVAFAYFITGAIFLYMAFLLIARYAILIILFIVSPLAFVFRVLPLEASKKLWTEWWQHFLKWCFVGVGLSFTLYLASQLIQGDFAEGLNSTNTITIIQRLVIVVIIMFVGIRISMKSGAPFAGLAMGLGTAAFAGTAGFVIGALGKTAAGAAKVTGVSGAAQRTKEGLSYYGTKLAEKFAPITGVRKGTAEAKYQERLQKQITGSESESRMSAIGADQRLKLANDFKYNKLLPFDPKKKEETAGLVKTLLKTGEFGALDIEKQKQFVEFSKNAIPGTIPMSDFAKVNPKFAAYDTEKVNAEKRKLIGKDSGLTDPKTGAKIIYRAQDMDNKKSLAYADMQYKAEQATIDSAYRKLNVNDIRELDKSALNMDFVKNTTAKRIEKAGEDLSADRKSALKKLLGKGGEIDKAGKAALAAGDNAKAEELRKIYATIRDL